MTVFVVNHVSDDISKAVAFGALRYINSKYVFGDELEKSVPPFSDDWALPPDHLSNMEQAAGEFNPDEDFLLIVGDHLQLLAFTAILFTRFNTAMVLRYDRKIQDYIPVRLNSGIAPGTRPVLSSNHIGDRHAQNSHESFAAPRPPYEQGRGFLDPADPNNESRN